MPADRNTFHADMLPIEHGGKSPKYLKFRGPHECITY
jgi:hypothetical protein